MSLSALRRFVACSLGIWSVIVGAVQADERDPLSAQRLNTTAASSVAPNPLSCRDQASARGLTRGDARHAFMRQCLTRKKAQRLEHEENCRSRNATLPTAAARRQALKRCLERSR